MRSIQRSSRIALLAGFGGLLGIIVFTGLDTWRMLSRYRMADEQIRKQYLQRNHLLSNIRSDLYLSGTYVRDYLLDPDPVRSAAFGASLASVRTQMDSDVASYERGMEGREAEACNALKAQLGQYWRVLEPVMHWDSERRQREGYTFLRDYVLPKRTSMLDAAEQIVAMNEQQLASGKERAAELLSQVRTRLLLLLAAAIVLGAGMAGFSARRILQLESRAQAKYLEAEEARRQLAHLSARLVEVQESERRSLARELHDEVGQALSAVLIELRNLLSGIGQRRADQTRQQAEVIRSLVEGAVRVVRNMSLLLRPSMLDDLGLVPALKWQAREVAKRTGLDVTVATELESEQLPEEYKTCVYRIVQEALHNSSRHAQATAVRIRIQQRGEHLLITVQDDGRGFDVKQSKGMGLLGIEERAAQLRGSCHIHSGPSMGTVLTVDLRLPAAAEVTP